MNLHEVKVMYDTVSERLAKAEADVERFRTRKAELAQVLKDEVEKQKALIAEVEGN